MHRILIVQKHLNPVYLWPSCEGHLLLYCVLLKVLPIKLPPAHADRIGGGCWSDKKCTKLLYSFTSHALHIAMHPSTVLLTH